jgi:septal ring factor EnvC (AmiA/AmiB activator)
MDKKFDNFSKKLTKWIGSPQSIIAHTIFFIGMFALRFFGVRSDDIMLVLTTLVSLEAIYLSIFIQMTVNKHAEELEEVSEDIDEIQEDVEGIQEDIEDIEEDVDEIQKDVNDIEEGLDEIAEEIQDDSEENP